MGTFFVLLIVVVVGFMAWRMRAAILAKVLGQDQGRVERRLDQRKR